MNLMLISFVWTVSLFYGSVLMPTVLTVIIIVLYSTNYLEKRTIRYSLSDIIHPKADDNISDKSEPRVKVCLERSDSNQSKINYFNYTQNYCIETIDENFEEDSPPKMCSRRSVY